MTNFFHAHHKKNAAKSMTSQHFYINGK